MDKLAKLGYNIWHKIIILSLLLQSINSHVSSVTCNVTNSECGSELINLEQEKLTFDYHEHNLNFSSAEISLSCRKSLEKLGDYAKIFDINALKLLDANAKITSGILSGNVNNFGDFDECIETKIEDFQGQYCLAEIQFEVHKNMEGFKKRILSDEPYKNDIDDISHILPRSSSILWGICAPSLCSRLDIEIALRNTIQLKFGKYLLSSHIKVTERNCQVQEESRRLSFGTKMTLTTAGIILLLTILATASDVFSSNTEKNEFLSSFSIIRNFKEIISTELSSSEIPSLNGIRFICTLLIIIGHKSMMTMFLPITNKASVGKLYASHVSIPHRSMFLYTEVFLMLSGLLLAHSLSGKLNKGLTVSIKKEILARYFRFIPSVIFLMLFSTFILPLLGNGPLWPDLVLAQSNICMENGWRNLLMIQNWFGFENICNFNLHHVGTDFILFIVLVPIIIYSHKHPKLKTQIIVILCVLSVIARFYVSYVTDMSIYIRFSSDVKQMMATANYMYGIPPYRLTSYCIGILLGYTLRNQKPKQLEAQTVKLGWIVALTCYVVTFTMATIVHIAYTPFNMALFSAIAPILFCACFAWIIYVSHHQSGNLITRFYEWKYFKITSTLSFALYLIQFQVFNYNIGTSRGFLEYSMFYEMFNLNELVIIFLAAFLMTLFIDLPFGNIKKIIFDKKTKADVKMTETKSQ